MLMNSESQNEPLSKSQWWGFLSDAAQKETEKFRILLPDWNELYFALNEHAQAALLQLSMRANNLNPQDLLIMSGFYRVLTSYQGVYLLVERGMDVESKVLLRSMTETTFVVSAASKDKTFVLRFLRGDESSRLRLLQNLVEMPIASTFLTPEKFAKMQTEVQRLKKLQAQGQNWNPAPKPSKIAKAAELEALYNQYYSYLCLYAHPTATGMGHYLSLDETGKPNGFRVGRHDEDADANVRTAVVLMLQVLSDVSRFFELNSKPRLSQFAARMESIISRSKTQKWSTESE